MYGDIRYRPSTRLESNTSLNTNDCLSSTDFRAGIRLEPGNREFPVRVKLPGKWHSNEGKTGKISFQYIFDRENDTKNRPKPGKKRTKY